MSEKVNKDVTIDTPSGEETQEGKEAVQAAKQAAQRPVQDIDPAEIANSVKRGRLTLSEPIMDGSKQYDELEFDFGKLRGLEVAQALDFGTGAKDAFRLNDVQALNYFACAAAKCQEPGGLDATDIRERIGGMDAIKAIQLATIFFRSSSRAGDRRLSSK